MIVKLLTEHHLEFLGLKGGCRGFFESTLVKMSNCWISHAAAQFYNYITTELTVRSQQFYLFTVGSIWLLKVDVQYIMQY